MRKAVVHGCFNTTNFGDLLLLEIIAKYLKDKWDIDSNTLRVPKSMELEYCTTDRPSFLDFISPKFAVYGGGGYLEDDGGTEAGKKVLLRYSLPAKVWNFFKVPYALVGAGAGPIVSDEGKSKIKYICKNANTIAIRDEKSIDLLKSIGVNRPIELTADWALSLKTEDIPKNRYYDMDAVRKTAGDRKIIGFHLEKIYDDKERFAKFCALNFFKDAEFKDKFHIIFFYDYSAGDLDWLKNEINKIDGLSYTIQPRMNHWTTVDFLRKCDAVLTTKLHVAIVSITFNVPVFGFSFHEKSARFFNEVGRGDYQKMWDGDVSCIESWMNLIKDFNNNAWKVDAEKMNRIKALSLKNREVLDSYIQTRISK